MTIPSPILLISAVLSWVAIFFALAVYGVAMLMTAALRLVLR